MTTPERRLARITVDIIVPSDYEGPTHDLRVESVCLTVGDGTFRTYVDPLSSRVEAAKVVLL